MSYQDKKIKAFLLISNHRSPKGIRQQKDIIKRSFERINEYELIETNNIIPNQLNIINSSKRNKKFDQSLSLAAKQRSIHNNYSTFLVLFIMLSGHYSFIVYNKYNWLILCAFAVISVLARHYFNLRGRNIHRLYILITSIVLLILLAVLILIFKN